MFPVGGAAVGSCRGSARPNPNQANPVLQVDLTRPKRLRPHVEQTHQPPPGTMAGRFGIMKRTMSIAPVFVKLGAQRVRMALRAPITRTSMLAPERCELTESNIHNPGRRLGGLLLGGGVTEGGRSQLGLQHRMCFDWGLDKQIPCCNPSPPRIDSLPARCACL